MHVIEIFLPLDDNNGVPFPASLFEDETRRLTEQFGGLTAFTRAPARGLWEDDGKTVSDRIVIFEVMADTVDMEWWTDYRRQLEARFRQDTILIRATVTRLL